MHISRYITLGMAMVSLLCGCRKEASVTLQLPERFEGKSIEIVSFLDSAVLLNKEIPAGELKLVIPEENGLSYPLLTQLMVDGRVKGYYIIEPGDAVLIDSLGVALGTPLNNRLSQIMQRLDSAEKAGGMSAYTELAQRLYNQNKGEVTGDYLAIEWLKYANPLYVDSMLSEAPESLRESRRAKHYLGFARLRAATAPGAHYSDLKGETANGGKTSLSRLIKPGKYTLVDFMASWCPYCIKDMPMLKKLRDDHREDGLEIVSVAVRDKIDDTRQCVGRHDITWPVLYNTGKAPYDVYGFSGIPHYMLIGPDGRIIARTETLQQITDLADQDLFTTAKTESEQ